MSERSETITLANITFDCDDVPAVAGFWSQVLGLPLADDPPPGEYLAVLGPSAGLPDSPGWMFVKVPERKTAKNRCHVDLHTDRRDQVQGEVDRLVALGATVIRDPAEEFGAYWATLQDPEGNEFCIGAP
jgi:predicted enzyme related to lactoylglutathione lyase